MCKSILFLTFLGVSIAQYLDVGFGYDTGILQARSFEEQLPYLGQNAHNPFAPYQGQPGFQQYQGYQPSVVQNIPLILRPQTTLKGFLAGIQNRPQPQRSVQFGFQGPNAATPQAAFQLDSRNGGSKQLFTPDDGRTPVATSGQIDNYKMALAEERGEVTTVGPSAADGMKQASSGAQGYVNVQFGTDKGYKYEFNY